MVNDALPAGPADDPEVALAIGYAPAPVRPALRTLWAFDARLGAIVRTTTQPLIGRMRLTWWHGAVTGDAPPAGEPLVAAVAGAGLDRAALSRMVDGWEVLLDGSPDPAALGAYAAGRGGGLFAAAAGVLGVAAPAGAGEGWALIDLARRGVAVDAAQALAATMLAAAPRRWPANARTLGALTKLARRDVAGPEPQASPRRVVAAALLALTGR